MANILMIVTSAGRMPNGKPTGLWLEEFAVPYETLRDAGHAVIAASPKGGDTPIDPKSAGDAEKHPEWEEAAKRLQQTQPLEGLRADDYGAVFIPGGHGTMFDFPDNPVLGALLADFHAQGKPIASVCHGPAAFAIEQARTLMVAPPVSASVACHSPPARTAFTSRVRVLMVAPRSCASSAFSTTSRASSTQPSE